MDYANYPTTATSICQISKKPNLCHFGRSGRKIHQFKFTWLIENFSMHPEQTGECILSPCFSNPHMTNQHWYMQLYPRGEEKSEFVDYLVACESSTDSEPVHAEYKIICLTSDDDLISKHEGTGLCEFGDGGLGVVEENKRDVLLAKLKEDVLVIRCEMKVSMEDDDTESERAATRSLSARMETLASGVDMEQLLTEQKFGDFLIKAGDQSFKVYKGVLAVQSAYFADLFDSDANEDQDVELTITDTDPGIVREILRFVYCEKLTDLSGMVEKLYVAADKYMVMKLKMVCEEHLKGSLSYENVTNRLLLADRHNLTVLKALCVTYAKKNIKALNLLRTFQTFLRENPGLAVDVLLSMDD